MTGIERLEILRTMVKGEALRVLKKELKARAGTAVAPTEINAALRVELAGVVTVAVNRALSLCGGHEFGPLVATVRHVKGTTGEVDLRGDLFLDDDGPDFGEG